VGVDAWTTPAAGTDYDAHSQPDGGGTALSGALTVTSARFGASMKLTVRNDHATLPAYLVDSGGNVVLQARGTPVQGSDPIPIREEDASSQADHGARTWQSRDTFIPSTVAAISWAKVNADLYQNSTPEISVTVAANRNSATLDQAQERDLGDRLTVRADGNAGLGFDQDWYIEGERHLVDSRFEHRVTWNLSAASSFDRYWVLGLSGLGADTKLAY
jgi:hypothetical protein